MPEYLGRAAPDAPMRELHRHTFVGVDVSLLAPEEFPGYDTMRELTRALLESSADMSMRVNPQRGLIEVVTANLGGHALPSGATAERQMWIEAIIRDEAGRVVFQSGTLDEHGDIRDGIASHSTKPGTDPQLAYYGQYLIEDAVLNGLTEPGAIEARKRELDGLCDAIIAGGNDAPSDVKVVTFPWEANWQCNRMIAADSSAKHTFDFGSLPRGKYAVELRLLFRTFPPYFLRKLEDIAGLDAAVKTRVPLVTMTRREAMFQVSALQSQ